MATPITFRGSPALFRRLMADLVQGLAGRGGPVAADIIRGVQLRVGVALLSCIQQAYVVKSRGGSAGGVKWPPLKPETIARRKRTAKDVAAGKRAIKAALRSGRKKPTVVELYGGRQVEILIDTRELFRSLSPGLLDRAKVASEMGMDKGPIGKGNEDQIFGTPPGQVIVGTKSDKAGTHQHGTAHVPKREMWPEGGSVPREWQPKILMALQTGLIAAVVLLASKVR